MEPFVTAFLRESNLIENVTDDDSLKQALRAWEYLISEKKLDHGVILKTHKILMLHQKIHGYERGYYRQRQVGIYKEKIVGIDPDKETLIVKKELVRECLDHKKIREEMEKWIDIANGVEYVATSPSTVEDFIKNCHIAFENIHPFIDGNGRIGRMLLNWQRLKVSLPLLIILNKNKKEYYDWFKKYD